MQFTASAAAILALISHALAQTNGFDAITKPTFNEVLTAGSTYQVTWDYDSQYDGTISITLLEGETATTLELGDVVASAIDNSAGSYSWTVGSDLGDDATYGLKITLDSDPSTFQYSFPFKITASGEGSSSSSSGTSAAVSTPASSSLSSPSAPSTISPASSSSSAPSTVPDTSATESATAVSVVTSTSPTATGVTKPASSGTMTQTTLTSVASATSTGSSTGSGTSSSPSAVVTAGAGKVVAGTFVAMGGLAAALLAL